HAVLGVPEILAAGERGHIPQAFELLVDGLEALAGHEDIDVDRQSTEPMGLQRHATGNRVWYADVFEPARDLAQGLEDQAVVLEMAVTFVHAPIPFESKTLFVREDGGGSSRSLHGGLLRVRMPRTSYLHDLEALQPGWVHEPRSQ